MNKLSFLKKASNSNCFISESKILTQLAELDKALIISMEELTSFSNFFFKFRESIEKLNKTKLYHISINNDGSCNTKEVGSRNMDESAIINMVNEKFNDYIGYCFVVNSGMQFLYHDGKFDEGVNSCLEKTKSMAEKLNMLKPLSKLEEVFAHFKIDCMHESLYYDLCFDKKSQKVKKDIGEQFLRNILLEYLNSTIQGEVLNEFCTDYTNDEESVDIYINDGTERAIIEVKFSISKKYYNGSTYYSITTRIGDGIKQLDKYSKHLAKDNRLVDYGYVYMFYMNDMDTETINKHIENKHNELQDSLSNEFFSIYKGIQLNDMKQWNSVA